MSVQWSPWRASLRMARRSIAQSKGRSALIAVMVGAPVAISVVVAALFLTNDLTSEEYLPYRMGSADAVATFIGDSAVADPDSGLSAFKGPGMGGDAIRSDLEQLVDGDVVPLDSGDVSVIGSAKKVSFLRTDFAVPMTHDLVRLQEGRLPRTPTETVITPNLRDQGHFTLGDDLQLQDGTTLTVVGTGAFGADHQGLGPNYGRPGLALTSGADVRPTQAEFLVSHAPVIDMAARERLADQGFEILTAASILDPSDVVGGVEGEASAGGWWSGADAPIVRLVVLCVILEVVLLAGPAFAVGVRRQRRDLALVAAAGGSPRDVRRLVLAQALVLGFLASVIGAVVGVVGSRALVQWVPPRWDFSLRPFELPWQLVVLAVLLGTGAAMLAALAPARQVARLPLPLALAGRRPDVPGRDGWPVLGACVGMVGLLMVGTSRTNNSGAAAAYGAIVLVIGVVFMTPMIVRQVGRTAGAFPLPLRLALRDSARHTSRSAPAIAAVMAAVAGITALGIGGFSDQAQGRATYSYGGPDGSAVIVATGDIAPAVAAVESVLPGRSTTPLATEDYDQGWMQLFTSDCGSDACEYETYDEADYYRTTNNTVVAADAATLRAWGVSVSAAQEQALDDGKALVASTGDDVDGTFLIALTSPDEEIVQTPRPDRKVSVVQASLLINDVPRGLSPRLAWFVVSPQTARALELPVRTSSLLVSGSLSEREEKDLATALSAASTPEDDFSLSVERGYQSELATILIVLAVGGGLAVLIGTLTATGLALVDAAPDFATLTAVGARPRTRRLMAASQALVIGLLGALLGVVVGIAPGVVASRGLTDDGFGQTYLDIPWSLLGILVVVVPMLAALVSGAFVRGTKVVTRRLAR
ncbi:hypothetical protein BH09ACT10_BH09ACT10_19740 [soil metagenome]